MVFHSGIPMEVLPTIEKGFYALVWDAEDVGVAPLHGAMEAKEDHRSRHCAQESPQRSRHVVWAVVEEANRCFPLACEEHQH